MIQFLLANYQAIIAGIVAILGGIITICLLIPGPQPEKALQSIVDFLTKFSAKKE